MATHATSTPTSRRSSRVARMAAPIGQNAPASQAQRRVALEEAIARGIAALDALDATAADLETDCDEEEDCETSAQPATLAPNWLAPARLHALRAVRS